MQDKGIIDILKVFERRITKLESKVAELEYGHDDVAEYSNGINDVSIGDLSAQTVEYNSLSSHADTKGTYNSLSSHITALVVLRRVRSFPR